MSRNNHDLDRRKFLALTGAAGGVSFLAGCGGKNTADGTSNSAGSQTSASGSSTSNGASGTKSTGTDQSSNNAKMGGTFQGSTSEDAPTLDPRMNELAWANSFLYYVFDTLLLTTEDGSKQVPHLAKELPKQKDDTTYVVPLRQGVKFHNGTELTADDVAYSFNWILDPKNKSTNRANLEFIDSVEATDKYEATFHLSYNFALFKQTLAGMNAPIVPKDAAKKMGTKKFGQKPIGTGPFKFVEHKSASYFLCERNEDYFLKKPNLAKLKMSIIPEAQTQYVDLATGDIDSASVPKALVNKAKSEKNVETTYISQLDYNGLIFNGMKEPFNNLKVRKAMQYLVSYDDMLQTSVGELGHRVYGFMPTQVNKAWGFPWQDWQSKYFPKKDHSKAKQLLKEAGYGDGFDHKLSMTTLSSSKFKNMLVVFQSELKKIGIKAEVQEVSTGKWLDGLDSGDFDVTMYGWGGGQDPDGFYYYLFRDLRNDDGGLSDGTVGNASAGYLYQSGESEQQFQAIDKKIRTARKTQDRDKRKQLYTDAAEFWQSQYPGIQVFSERSMTAWNKRLQDYKPTTFSVQELCNEWHNTYIQK